MTLSLHGHGKAAESYIRIACLAIAGYDYILTLPAEWRFYKSQRSWRLSLGCILFIIIRYLSMATLIVSNVGFFGEFSEETCSHLFIAAPVFKVAQIMVAQIILSVRTVNISRRSPWVVRSLIVTYLLVTSMEWFTNLYERVPVQDQNQNCTSGNNVAHLSVWLYYVLAMYFDLVTLGISTFYLVKFARSSNKMSELVKLMLYDGLGYFVVLTCSNIVNLILYRTTNEETQTAGASIGYMVTWIMSQRILIHLRDAAAEHNRNDHVVVTRQLESARDISRAMRSQFEAKTAPLDEEYAIDMSGASGARSGTAQQSTFELDVTVQIEHSVTVDYDSRAYERESYRSPRVIWDTQSTGKS